MNNKSPIFESNPFTVLWNGLNSVFKYTATMSIVVLVAPFVLGFVGFFLQVITEIIFPTNEGQDISSSALLIGFSVSLLVLLFQIIIQFILTGMATLTGLRSTEAKDLTVNEALTIVWNKIGKMAWAALLIVVRSLPAIFAMTAVLVLSIVAGINNSDLIPLIAPVGIALFVIFFVLAYRVFLRYSLTYFVIFDKGISAKESMKTSKKLTEDRLIEIFGISSIGSIVPIINPLLVPAGLARTYQQRKQVSDNSKLPKPHILNYLMIVVFLGFTLLFIGLVSLIVALAANN